MPTHSQSHRAGGSKCVCLLGVRAVQQEEPSLFAPTRRAPLSAAPGTTDALSFQSGSGPAESVSLRGPGMPEGSAHPPLSEAASQTAVTALRRRPPVKTAGRHHIMEHFSTQMRD